MMKQFFISALLFGAALVAMQAQSSELRTLPVDWREIPNQVSALAMIAAPDGSLLIVNHQLGGPAYYRSTDGGNSWNPVVVNFQTATRVIATMGSDIFTLPFAFGSPDQIITLHRSATNGQSWTENIVGGLPKTLSGINKFFSSDSQLFIIAADGSEQYILRLYRSDDGGITWSELKNGLPTLTRINGSNPGAAGPASAAVGGKHLFVTHTGRGANINSPEAGVYRSSNNGTSWEKVLDDNNRPFADIATSNKFVVAESRDTQKSELFLSRDGGTSWAVLSKPPSTYATSPVIWEDKFLLTTTEKGMFIADLSKANPVWSALGKEIMAYIRLVTKDRLFAWRYEGLFWTDLAPLRTALSNAPTSITEQTDETALEDRQSVYPHPATEDVTICAVAQAPTLGSVRIMNIMGNTVKTFPHSLSSGKNCITFNVNDLSPGAYTLELNETKRRQYFRFIKQ
jgi:photosystem II stability/assembly factor-like uncharacterized protein